MKSITLFTTEIDDLELAIEELKQRLEEKRFTFQKNTCGIAFFHDEVEAEELSDAFRGAFDFPIMGCTALAMLTKADGYQVSGISLLILTADDCEFYMDMTKGIDENTAEEEIRSTYNNLSKKLPEKEKLILMYGSKTFETGGDTYVNVISESAGGVPVYGALASDHFAFKDYHVICKDRVENMAVAMLLITGNVHPVFRAEFSLNHLTNFSAKITSAKGSLIYTLDGKPFMDVLEQAGLKSQQENTDNVIMEFVGTPFLVAEEMENGEKVQKLRNLVGLNPKDGSGKFLGNITEGATLHIGLMRKEDVQSSIASVFTNVMAQIEKSDYEYSTLLCSSCGSRYLILATEPDAEAHAYKDILPENTELAGFYSYGEICPEIMESGNIYNCFHNDTFTILAI